MKDVLGANPCPSVVPIGAEESFKGLVDPVSYTHLQAAAPAKGKKK